MSVRWGMLGLVLVYIMSGYFVGVVFFFFFHAEAGIRGYDVTGVQTCALPISASVSITVSEWTSCFSAATPCQPGSCWPQPVNKTRTTSPKASSIAQTCILMTFTPKVRIARPQVCLGGSPSELRLERAPRNMSDAQTLPSRERRLVRC